MVELTGADTPQGRSWSCPGSRERLYMMKMPSAVPVRGFILTERHWPGTALLVRDGCRIKVRGRLPLEPYLLWAAGGTALRGADELSTPAEFSTLADQRFSLTQAVKGKE